MKQIIYILFLLFNTQLLSRLQAQTASFNFSLASHTVSGWTNVAGDPSTGIRSRTSNGITVSSVATANWAGYNSAAAFDGGGASGGTFFPSGVLANFWFQYSSFFGAYNAAVPQLEISGLNIDSVYTIKMTGSYINNVPATFNLNPMRYTVSGTSVYGFIDVNGNFNTADGATFHNIAPNSSGKIHIYVNTLSTTNVAGIGGLQITSGHTSAPTPVVTLTKPSNNDIIPEDGNVTITATATETGGSISRVEFYADTTMIGVDSSAPYGMVWASPDPGNYTIKARVIDGVGNTNSATINISVESLNYFWSTTGNIAVNSDSFFLGTVDTSRFVIRTRNIPRLAIDSGGNVNIMLKHPSAFTIKKATDTSAARPAFKVYDNGDLVASTTMDRSVSTEAQTGMRYYAKAGILQVGASDRLDTTADPIVYGHWPTSGIIINSDSSNIFKGKLINTLVAGDVITLDSSSYLRDCFIGSESSHFTSNMHNMIRSVMASYGTFVDASVDASILSGQANPIFKPVESIIIGGIGNVTLDTAVSSLIEGNGNKYGGIGQLAVGQGLVNKTPYGTALGNGNVDFTSLSYTGLRGTAVPGLSGYPVFTVGNSFSMDTSVRSNAITVLYNGRTQINSAGHTNALSQADVTPKAALEVVSTNSGVLLPKLTNEQRNAIAASDLVNGLLLYNTDSSSFQFYNGSAWTSVGSGTGGTGHWQFSSGVQYDTTNNIAIGTTTVPAGYKLAVNGTAIFTKVRVKTAGTWPDYVFKKGYVLPDLNELERYIAVHKHLPGIVSESEANQDGVDVGDHQEAMLKKVEELTLYLIDENNRLKEQSKQAERQSTQIAEQNKQIGQQNARLEKQQREIDELKELIRNRK